MRMRLCCESVYHSVESTIFIDESPDAPTTVATGLPFVARTVLLSQDSHDETTPGMDEEDEARVIAQRLQKHATNAQLTVAVWSCHTLATLLRTLSD